MLRNISFLLLIIALISSSCEKYLAAKPDKSLSTPSSLKDLQAILDYEELMNHSYPSMGEMASDNYYLSLNDWNVLSANPLRDVYNWDPSFDYTSSDWTNIYRMVFQANVVLDNIEKVAVDQEETKNKIKGAALFYRSYAIFKGAQVYTLPFTRDSAKFHLGMPLIMTADVNAKNARPSLFEMYERLIHDLKEASQLLPDAGYPATRPGKAAAFGTLAYIYLIMGDFTESNRYSDSCLMISNKLMNYSSIQNAIPFPVFNIEVIFQSRIFSSPLLVPLRCKVDTVLYNSYSSDDLRKSLYFKVNADGSYAFVGSYDANPTNAVSFGGITTDEMYLIKAESLARLGKTDEAMSWLNNLLKLRWKENTFIDLTAESSEEALTIILRERRKELCFRGGIRWTDLRRLNTEPDKEITLKRTIGSEEYTLPPRDRRYAFRIPSQVIEISGIEQNK